MPARPFCVARSRGCSGHAGEAVAAGTRRSLDDTACRSCAANCSGQQSATVPFCLYSHAGSSNPAWRKPFHATVAHRCICNSVASQRSQYSAIASQLRPGALRSYALEQLALVISLQLAVLWRREVRESTRSRRKACSYTHCARGLQRIACFARTCTYRYPVDLCRALTSRVSHIAARHRRVSSNQRLVLL